MKRKVKTAVGICSYCHDVAEFELVDNGIGSYEYWGAIGNHEQWDWESICCGAFPEGEVKEKEE